ncbi:hypothetical protein MUK42_33182 [Musa troglodytarum]|uniref:Uncharacterized protein n=1 Tax=Musa troglodytarum TaxID=320322 RepID=A0A9E7JP57_9LILI|nr:hypothetical protein MUK42_33182 [Musa troglodytarum]
MKLRLLLVVSRPPFSANQHKNHIHQNEQVDFSCYYLFFFFFRWKSVFRIVVTDGK